MINDKIEQKRCPICKKFCFKQELILLRMCKGCIKKLEEKKQSVDETNGGIEK